MSDVAIRVEGLSKQYRIGGPQARYKTLRESLSGAAQAPILRVGRLLHGEAATDHQETIWALKDVSFEVKHGEVLGIIGRNGAGKSTLLKILSRITAPTEGTVDLYGRVGSLLEVGTGFHPELTGRENIYLNGAIMGMKRAEIDRKFDEIVAFAEIEKFLDTPAKHYSSGMYVRLAFAVAAHLDPEILLVDEVLAVGDAAFQKKCLGKMGEVAGEGRTVLFVSHNMAAVNALCHAGLHLDCGAKVYLGGTRECMDSYLGETKSKLNVSFAKRDDLPIQLLSVRIEDEDGNLAAQHPHDRPLWLRIGILVHRSISNVYVAVHIHDRNLETLLFSRDFESDETHLSERRRGQYMYSIRIPAPLLVPGTYRVSVHIAHASPAQLIDGNDHVGTFRIVDGGSLRAKMGFPWRGKIFLPLEWICESFDEPSDSESSGRTELSGGPSESNHSQR